MEESMTVYFIRHNWDGPEWTPVIQYLFENNKIKIGVHFDNVQPPADPFDPNQYAQRAAKTAIRYLNECSRNQHLVVSSYRNQNEILIGLSKVNSKDTQLINGYQIKYVQLTNVRRIQIDEFPLPFLIPPPYATIVRWNMGELAVNSFYFKKEPELTLDLLSPWHLEILVEEWLRRKQLLSRKLFKTGGAMKEMDIVGISPQGGYIVAQVKYSCTDNLIEEFFQKINLLHNTVGYFFTVNPNNHVQHERLIDLQDVFDDFLREEQNYLRKLIFGRL